MVTNWGEKKDENKKKNGEEGERPCAKSTGNCRQAEIEGDRERQFGLRQQGVDKVRPVLRQNSEGNEGEGRTPEGRTWGPVHPEH